MHRWRLVVLAATGGILPAAAQGPPLPAFRVINPVVSSRSGLGFIPLQEAGATWRLDLNLDYASMIELDLTSSSEYVLDSEVLRLAGTVTRQIGERGFVRVIGGVGGAYSGFLDEPLNAYHDLIGLDRDIRNSRPSNQFAYRIDLPNQAPIERQASRGFLSDLIVAGGFRLTRHWQIASSVTLPTSTGPTGYGVGTVATALTTSARSDALRDRVTFEGSAALGFTPKHGDLEPWQRGWFGMATAGGRLRFWGQQSVYVNFGYHSPVYHDTGLRSLDGSDVSIDVGFVLRPSGAEGPELLAALTEDLYPNGPAVDVVFRLGVRW